MSGPPLRVGVLLVESRSKDLSSKNHYCTLYFIVEVQKSKTLYEQYGYVSPRLVRGSDPKVSSLLGPKVTLIKVTLKGEMDTNKGRL